MTELSLLTWNIRQGGSAARLSLILKWIMHHDADVMVITEFQNKREGSLLQSALRDSGWVYQYCPILVPHKNTVLIAARHKFDVIDKPPSALSIRNACFAIAEPGT